MPRTFAGAVLLVALALLPPGKAVAGPPGGPSGKTVLDQVADGLRKYRAEMEPERRIRWLEKLAPSGDPRVGLVLIKWMDHPTQSPSADGAAYQLLERYYPAPQRPKQAPLGGVGSPLSSEPFRPYADLNLPASGLLGDDFPFHNRWERVERDLRRRASQLPQ